MKIQEQYNLVVRQFTKQTRKQRVASLLPGAVGGGVGAAFSPVAGKVASGAVSSSLELSCLTRPQSATRCLARR